MANILNEKKLTDVNLSFKADPNTGDIARLNKFAVIRRSLENILFSKTLEKPFREDLGSPLSDFLFEVTGTEDMPVLETIVKNTIKRHEPRIKLQRVTLTPDFNNNRIDLTIQYVILTTFNSDTFTTFLGLSE